MYFGSYRLPNMWLDNCLKSLVSEVSLISKRQTGPNTIKILMRVHSPYLLITVEAIKMGEDFLSDIKNLKA